MARRKPVACFGLSTGMWGLLFVTTTNNRSLLGTVNDLSFLVSHHLREHPQTDLVDAALWLSRTPVGTLRHERPRDVARRLLASSFFG